MHSEVNLGQEWKQNPVSKSKRQNNWDHKAALCLGYAQESVSVGLEGLWGSVLNQPQPRVLSGTRHVCSCTTSQPCSQTPRAARGGSYMSSVPKTASCPIRYTQQGHVQYKENRFTDTFPPPLNSVKLLSRSPPEHSLLFTSIKLRYNRILTIHCKIQSQILKYKKSFNYKKQIIRF